MLLPISAEFLSEIQTTSCISWFVYQLLSVNTGQANSCWSLKLNRKTTPDFQNFKPIIVQYRSENLELVPCGSLPNRTLIWLGSINSILFLKMNAQSCQNETSLSNVRGASTSGLWELWNQCQKWVPLVPLISALVVCVLVKASAIALAALASWFPALSCAAMVCCKAASKASNCVCCWDIAPFCR